MKHLFKLVLGLLVAYIIYRFLTEYLRPIQVWLPEATPPLPRPDSTPPPEPEPGGVDLNRADAEALIALPGIGPALAERVIAHREQHGPLTQLDDLIQVSGIGPALVDRLRPLVTVN